tara:strand:- start:105 stop:362 length:258 start_codon:yes stop_codon:yes gene_type:complete
MSAWIINKKQSGYHTIKRDEGHLPMVADVYGTDEEAQLIAAAPDLLAALENLLAGTIFGVEVADFEAAKKAIAKAKPVPGNPFLS